MFRSARIKLTFWYLLVIMAISFMFSLVIYGMLAREVDRFEQLHRVRIQRRMAPINTIEPDQELTQELRERVVVMLVMINGGIFLVAGGLGYMLAGRTLKPIQVMMDEQNRFVSDASHELRTPLTSLKTAMEVFLREKKPSISGAKLLINESIEEVDRLQVLSESLLHLAHYQGPGEKPPLEPTSLKRVLNKSLKRMKPMAQKKHIKLNLEGDYDYDVMGDFDELVKALVIFIDNAVKYSDDKSPVTVSVKETNKCAFIDVTDKGIGIDQKDMKCIFYRFYRADSARSKASKEGYGLGLSIAKKIIDDHDGAIKLASQLKKGTTFTIRLPRAK